MNRRELLKTALAAPLATAVTSCERAADKRSRTARPNILFCFADDQSWPHAGALGDTIVNTPAFDRVAREGVLFHNSFATCPSCTPSRSSVLTGRHIWQLEQGGVLYGTLPAKYPLVTHLLEDAGYHVGWTGKPWAPGNWQAGGLERHPNGREYNRRRFEQPIAAGLDERDYAANFEDFLADRPAGAPFFFWFGSTEPHRVYEKGIGLKSGKRLEDVEVPPYWPDTPEVRSDILDYYYEVEWFDRQVAKMLQKLEQKGELENTLVVVTSDNGMPFPRAKVNLYDPGVRMPLAIRWGERVGGGREIDDFLSHADFAPTFLEAAGIQPPDAMTGRSILATLMPGESGMIKEGRGRDHVFTALERHTWCRPGGATYPMRAIRTREYLYIHNFEPQRWPTGGPEFVSSNKTYHGDVDACPTKTFMVDPENQHRYAHEYEMCFGKRPLEELYSVRDDPHQVRNLAQDAGFQLVKQELWRRLQSYLRESGDPRIEGRDPWQGYVYHQTAGFGATFNHSLPEEERERARQRGAHKPE